MNHRKRIPVRSRTKAVASGQKQSFQAEIVPNAVLEGDALTRLSTFDRPSDLELRPVYHQLDDRIDAHVFTAFMALCLLQTLRREAHSHAPSLTPQQIIEKFRTVKMVDVVLPTTDGRMVTLPRYIEPKDDVVLLLDRLGFTLPEQPPPKISADVAESAQAAV